jgi:hypothetical protein
MARMWRFTCATAIGILMGTILARPASAVGAVTWRGEDERGGDVAQGVYVLRLEAGPRVATTKVILTR